MIKKILAPLFIVFVTLPLFLKAQQSVTFNYTGSVQTWTVPPCVFCLNVDVRGAAGGGILSNPYAGSGQGGRGARVQHTCIPVQPGQVLEIRVGGCPTNHVGGYNGGGNGHNSATVQMSSKGGGGATDIRVAPYAMGNRIVVAGGGGGRAGGSQQQGYQASGGNGGCANGVAGAGSPFTGTGGGGGSQVAGGNGGPPWGGGQPGQAGSVGQGGTGGFYPSAAGGGGGGGYYGGGGGGGDNCCQGANGGGGGGGGSSFYPAAGATCTPGFQSGDGQVTITYAAGGINISATNTGPYCAGQTIQLNATNGATTYTWTGPNGFTSNLQNPTIPNATPQDSGLYTLNYVTPSCNGTTTTLVIVNTPINPSFTQIPPICENGTVPSLPGASNNNPPLTGTWSPSVISSAAAGTYPYVFTPAPNFCANTATMNIVILPNEIPTFNQINPMCINDTPPALPNPSTNATPYTGTWAPPTITTASAGVYTYTFTPTVGQCAVSTNMTIAILNYTMPTFQQIGPLCQFTTGVTLPASSSNVVPIVGTWNPPNINTQTPGIFLYQFTPNPFQCADTTSMYITINPLIIPQFTPMPLVCQGDVPPVFPLVSNNNPGIVGSWNPPTIDSSLPGTFTFFFTPDPNQCADSVTMNVIVVPSVPPSFQADSLTGCNPLMVNFTTPPVPGATYTYTWNGATIGVGSTIDYMFTAGGCHTITLQYNLQGCIETTTYTDYICMENYPNTTFMANPNVLSSTSETINFTNTTIGATSYLWQYGDGQTSTVFEEPHFYNGITENILVSLTGYTPLGCATTFELTLPVISDPIYYVPNTFTPDQDEHNQTWFPVFTTGFDPYNFELKIFNRWGETIWESHDSRAEWDGTYGADGSKVQAGLYTWVIKYSNKETDDKKVVSGFVNVLR